MISNILIISLLSTSFKFDMYPKIYLQRRDFLSSTNIIVPFLSKKNITKVDKYADWSLYKLISPPIEKTLTYNELLEEIKKKNIIKLQQAPQHDCIIATSRIGYRWACLIKDKDLENVNNEINIISNDLQILPIEKKYIYIRSIWQIWLSIYIFLFTTILL